MNALQLVLEELPTEHDERLRAILDGLTERFIPQLANQACLDLHELIMALSTELAFAAGATLKPESALQFVSMLADAIHAGATCETETHAADEPEAIAAVNSLH